jgi:hypothetical protein
MSDELACIRSMMTPNIIHLIHSPNPTMSASFSSSSSSASPAAAPASPDTVKDVAEVKVRKVPEPRVPTLNPKSSFAKKKCIFEDTLGRKYYAQGKPAKYMANLISSHQLSHPGKVLRAFSVVLNKAAKGTSTNKRGASVPEHPLPAVGSECSIILKKVEKVKPVPAKKVKAKKSKSDKSGKSDKSKSTKSKSDKVNPDRLAMDTSGDDENHVQLALPEVKHGAASECKLPAGTPIGALPVLDSSVGKYLTSDGKLSSRVQMTGWIIAVVGADVDAFLNPPKEESEDEESEEDTEE